LNKILEEIKAVQGVSGVLILDLKTSVTYQLLPAYFEKEGLHSLVRILLIFCQQMGKPIRMDLKFDNGMALFTRLNTVAVLVYGRPSLNLSLLKLVLKSSIATIEKRIMRRREKIREAPEDKTSISEAQIYVKPLVEMINQIASVYQRYTGTYLLTQNLRQAREKLLKEFPFLINFTIDNNGKVLTIKGKEDLAKEDVTSAFARWVSLLKELCQKFSPEIRRLEVADLTKDLAEKLEEIGFYQLCDK
jgi:hypothetical protein